MKQLKLAKKWLQRLLMFIGIILILLIALALLSIRYKELDGSGEPYGSKCVSQNFEKGGDIRLEIAQRFSPFLILDKDEPANGKDIGLILRVEKWGDGYKVTYQIFYTHDWGTKNLVWGNKVWYLVKFAAKIIGTFGGHPGDAESIVVYVDNMGFNDIGEHVYSLVKVEAKTHQNWRFYYPSTDKINCELGVSPVLFVSQGTHAMYASASDCNSNIGDSNTKASTDKCSHGEEVKFEVLPEFDVGTVENPNDPLSNSPVLQELFPNESLCYSTFCGGKRDGDEVCEPRLNFNEIRRSLIAQNKCEVP